MNHTRLGHSKGSTNASYYLGGAEGGRGTWSTHAHKHICDSLQRETMNHSSPRYCPPSQPLQGVEGSDETAEMD